ncbi:MAG TPA: membrane protein insertase YidC [Bacteroidota bacterium]|nr:membrane protein insertase YidC [Bacteroidota bacterium]
MDRQSTIGFILIFIVLVVWMWLNSSKTPQQTQRDKIVNVKKDSAMVEKAAPTPAPATDTVMQPNAYGKYFSSRARGKEQIITIETELYRAQLSSKGGVIKTWELKNYQTWDGKPVQLVDYDHQGDLSVLLTTSDGRVINTHDLYFDVQAPETIIKRTGTFEFEIVFSLPASNGGMLIKRLKFHNGEYGFDEKIQFENLSSVVANYQYEVLWEHGIRYAERNSIEESNFAAGYAYAGGELTQIDATKIDQKEQKEISGAVNWVATRDKYFGIAMIPIDVVSEGAYLEGNRRAMPSNGALESYAISLKMPYKGGVSEGTAIKVFLGPLQHSILKSYNVGLENIMSLGWAWLVRPISEYIMLPIFLAIHSVVSNWGLVIIIFSILIKLALHPLSKKQMESMKKMQKLQPMMDEIREKYKDDPQRMNQAVMNLYKEYGVNPAGGCLPLLFQLPIMYALYAVFRGAIELRHSSFIWWIKDLSSPDVIYTLPFGIPIMGSEISGIALLMGVSMFIQSKQTVQDPRQKSMIWMMPIMMTLVFNSLPSGLNLYYAVFNVIGIVQQIFINKKHEDEPLRKVEPKKKNRGGIFKLAKDMPRLKK